MTAQSNVYARTPISNMTEPLKGSVPEVEEILEGISTGTMTAGVSSAVVVTGCALGKGTGSIKGAYLLNGVDATAKLIGVTATAGSNAGEVSLVFTCSNASATTAVTGLKVVLIGNLLPVAA